MLRAPDDVAYSSTEGANGRGALWDELRMAQASRPGLAIFRFFQ